MISMARVFALATACVALLVTGARVTPAGAQGDNCKGSAVTAVGKAKFRPFSKAKELEGRGSAMDDAVAAWQREVLARYGEQWKGWEKAKDTSFNCVPTKSEKLGLPVVACTVIGRPCAAAAPLAGVTTKERDSGGKDKGRPAMKEPPKYSHPAHAREMARQDRMAAERDKAERAAYDREIAIQRKLEEQRARNPRY
jgi:hypothetical protein